MPKNENKTEKKQTNKQKKRRQTGSGSRYLH